jgi:hypothetical protein
MNPDMERFLNLEVTPARLTAEQAAWSLGFSPHEIPILIARGLLKPLGHPQPNTVKFFPAAIVEELRKDVKWLSRATDAIMEHWRSKNARKTNGGETSPARREAADSAHAVDAR